MDNFRDLKFCSRNTLSYLKANKHERVQSHAGFIDPQS